jgi:CheY-like chemotaxis protein
MILDMQMPGATGLEVVSEVKKLIQEFNQTQ